MMEVQKEPEQEEVVFEWIVNEETGQYEKITSKNSNGRMCSGCNHKCPCRCACCKPFCCSTKLK